MIHCTPACIINLWSFPGLNLNDIDIFEINEAFASQARYCVDKLGIPMEKVNPKGGAIALGHPLGCTGARQMATLLHEMKRRGKKYVGDCIPIQMNVSCFILFYLQRLWRDFHVHWNWYGSCCCDWIWGIVILSLSSHFDNFHCEYLWVWLFCWGAYQSVIRGLESLSVCAQLDSGLIQSNRIISSGWVPQWFWHGYSLMKTIDHSCCGIWVYLWFMNELFVLDVFK